jgi:rhodanese-related sulfurtransferase
MELPLAEGPAAGGTAHSCVDQLLERARSCYKRVSPTEAWRVLTSGGLLVDIRPAAQRAEFGEIPGAIVIERNVLEWRLDPTSPHHHPAVTGTDQDIVVVCQAGYASSLAAATLREMGLSGVADLEGGYAAWVEAGLLTTCIRSGPGSPSEVETDRHEAERT